VFKPCYANCYKLGDMLRAAIQELGINTKIKKATDILEIIKNTSSTPAIIINGKLKY